MLRRSPHAPQMFADADPNDLMAMFENKHNTMVLLYHLFPCIVG